MKTTQPILVISTGRTGTIFFARLFAELYPQAASYHERGISRPIQILTNLHFAGLLPLRGLKAAWRILKGREIETCAKPFHIDSSCFLYGLAALAPELYPGLKVIHIVRDPRSYVTSHLNFSRQKRTSFIANYLIPFWQPSPAWSGTLALTTALSFTRFQRFCWIWNFKNGVMERLEHTATPYLRVRFEDLFDTSEPEEVFGRVTDFIGLPRKCGIRDRFREPANVSSKSVFPDWPEWTPRQCAQLDALCGERMRYYGYGGEGEWTARIAGASEVRDL